MGDLEVNWGNIYEAYLPTVIHDIEHDPPLPWLRSPITRVAIRCGHRRLPDFCPFQRVAWLPSPIKRPRAHLQRVFQTLKLRPFDFTWSCQAGFGPCCWLLVRATSNSFCEGTHCFNQGGLRRLQLQLKDMPQGLFFNAEANIAATFPVAPLACLGTSRQAAFPVFNGSVHS